MDLANYASELIKQRGELYVPGLGYFAHSRKSSYYDAETGTVYPPYFEINFDPHRTVDDDNELARYITERKNISLASARFFLDKFVHKIKEQAETDEVAFSDLGYFFIDHQARLAFRPKHIEMHQNVSLYGYQPVQLQKLKDIGQPLKPRPEVKPIPVVEKPEQPVAQQPAERETAEPVSEPVSSRPLPVQEQEPASGPVLVTNTEAKEPEEEPAESYSDEEEDGLGTASNVRFWAIVIIVVAVAAGGFIYYYKSRFGKFSKPPETKKTVIHGPLPQADEIKRKADTTKKADDDSVHSLDSAPKILENQADSLKRQEDSLNKAKNQPAGQQAPKNQQPVSQPAAPQVSDLLKPLTSATVQTPVKYLPKGSWLILGGHFKNYDNAVKALNQYRGMGYHQARLIDSVQHKEYFIYQIVFGYRASHDEAISARNAMLNEKKIKPSSIYIKQYKQNQK